MAARRVLCISTFTVDLYCSAALLLNLSESLESIGDMSAEIELASEEGDYEKPVYHAKKDKTTVSVASGELATVSRGKARAFNCDLLCPFARLVREVTHKGSFGGGDDEDRL